MNKARKWIQPILVAAALIAFMIWDTKYRSEIDREIKLHGARAHAVVIDTHYARGQSMDIQFIYEGKYYLTHFARTSEFQVASGDSVSILFLPNQPSGDILVEDRIFTVPRKSRFD